MKSYDIVVVGAGVIGLAIAYELKNRHGKLKIAVLDKGPVGREASWASAGMLEPPLTFQSDHYRGDDGLQKSFFNLCVESQLIFEEYVRRVEWISKTKCDYRREGILKLLLAGQTPDVLLSWYNSQGIRTDFWDEFEAGDREPALNEGFSAIHLPDHHQVDNRKLVTALAEACRTLGVVIEEDHLVRDFVIHAEHAISVNTERDSFSASHFVLSAGSWSSQFEALKNIVPDVKPIRGQIVALQMPRRDFVRYAAEMDGFYYVPRNDGRLLVGSTLEDAGFDKLVKEETTRHLMARLGDLIPASDSFEIVEQWCGLRPVSADGFPMMGGTELKNLSVATAHFRNGILLMPITAKLMVDVILEKRTNILLKPFGVARLLAASRPTS